MSTKIIKKHNVVEWFGSNEKFLTYFETQFDKNTIGRFKAPGSTVRRNNNLATDADRAKLAGTIANIYISAVSNSPKGKLLTSIEFNWLLPETQEELKSAAAEAVQHAVLNKHIWEKVNASSISTPNFSVNVDTTNWLLSSDMFGMIAKNMITNSGLGKYKIVGDNFLGDARFKDSATGEIVLYKWDNSNKPTEQIDGDRYLVYDGYVLIGTKGTKGDKGDKGDSITGPIGPKGDTGADSTVPGPKGDTGKDGKGITPAIQAKLDNMPDDTVHELAIVNQDIQDLKDKDVELEGEMTAADTIFAKELGLVSTTSIDLGEWTANTASDVWETGDITGKLTNGKEYLFNIQTGGTPGYVYKFFNDAAQTQPATFTAGNTGLKKLYKSGLEYNLTVDNNKLGLTRVNGSAFWTGGLRFSPNILEVPAKTLKQEVETLKSGGVYLGDIEPQTQNVIAELNTAFPSAKDGDHAEAITGVGSDIKYTTYTKAGTSWTKGSDKVIHLKGSAAVDAYTKTEMDAKVQFYEGELKEFIKEKTGTKFEDTTLFDKHLITDGQAIVGGTDGSTTDGQTKTTGLQLRVNTSSGFDGNVFGWNRNNASGLGSMNTEGGGANGVQGYVSNSKDGQPIISGGGAQNKAYGIKLLKVVYVAKKDITFGEMK